jgi:hypothetical protein
MTLTKQINDDTMNHVLTKLKYVEGSKIYIGDANAITGSSARVIIEAFSELGKEVKRCKMVKNGQCYGALLNVEPIVAEDRNCTIRKDPKWTPPIPSVVREHAVTPLAYSEFGKMEIMTFWVVANGSYIKDPKRDKDRGYRGVWMVIEDTFGRRFVTVRPEHWDNGKVNVDPSNEGPYYGRVKISDNTTRIEPGLKYINLYEVELYDSAEASQLADSLEYLLDFKD